MAVTAEAIGQEIETKEGETDGTTIEASETPRTGFVDTISQALEQYFEEMKEAVKRLLDAEDSQIDRKQAWEAARKEPEVVESYNHYRNRVLNGTTKINTNTYMGKDGVVRFGDHGFRAIGGGSVYFERALRARYTRDVLGIK